jgi:DNA replicative helicase MCM subunit Mcm2 (Cdc46/Mcm family)
MDKLLSSHVMALHAGAARPGAAAAGTARFGGDGGGGGGVGGGGAGGGGGGAGAEDPFAAADGYDVWKAQGGMQLAQRLREAAAKFTEGQLLPPPLLRKYIAYARAHVQPALTSAARAVLDEFYLQVRGG